VLYPEELRLRAPSGLNQALKLAASRRHSSAPEYVRQALLRSLEQNGLFLRSDGTIEDLAAAPVLPQQGVCR
jgi:hypothetical protein